MSGVVTVPYLRRRFWVAKLVLLVTLAAAAGVAVFSLRAQEDRSEYAIALQHLGNSVTRLEQELDHLAFSSRRGVGSRAAARTIFNEVDALFRRIVLASGEGEAPSGRPGRAGRGENSEGKGFHLSAGAMPDSLARIWAPGSAAPEAGPSASLEYVLDRILLLTGQLVRGEGPLSPREADRVQTIKSSVATLVTPRLEEITAVLDEDVHASVDRALVSLLALLAVAAVVAVLNVFVIFRPLEHAVMAAQARLEVERDRALEAAAAKRKFLSVVSHELRTPMNGVLGFAELLLASDLRPEQRRQVEIIRSSGKTLLALVNDLLDLSRMEGGGLELADEAFSLEEIIAEVTGLARAGAAGKDIETAVYIDPRLPERLRGDPERVRQILTNLVGNAVKFTERGTVAVEARLLGPESAGAPNLELAVSDTGPGVPPDQQARIFERFTQAEGAGRSGAKGTGLGLAICRELSELMGGGIGVESSPGEGATFRVRLRLAAVEERIGSGGRQAMAAPLAGMRVLIVDPSRITAGIIRRQLEDSGLAAETVATAEDAWQNLEGSLARNSPYGVVLLGGPLVDANPAAFARRVRQDARLAGVRLLLLARTDGEGMADEAAAAFDAVETQPPMPRTLLRTLARLAGGNSIEAEAEAEAAQGAQEGSPRARVLLAEDDAVSQQLVIRLLEGAGYRVDAVGDGQSAVEAAAAGESDLILMDIRMPEMDGVEAARRIRALGGPVARMPILALTANTAAEDTAAYRAAGMNGVIAKPIEAERLLAAIRLALRDAAVPCPSRESAEPGPSGVAGPAAEGPEELAATR